MELTAVFTNKIATDAYRGAGRPEASFIVEANRRHHRAGIENGSCRRSSKEFPEIKRVSFWHRHWSFL